MSPPLRNGRHRTTIVHEPPATTVLLRRRSKELERHLPAAIAGNARAVHRARVASRRLREALPIVAPSSKARRKAGRKIRRVTRALGLVRELDVAVGILDELAQRQGIPRDALEDVRGYVVGERDVRRAQMGERLSRFKTARLSRRLEEVTLSLPSGPEGDWRDSLATRIAHRAERLSAAMAAAGQMYAPDPLHKIRIAAKKLRYALELAGDTGLPAAPLVASLKRAQDILGRLHDLQIIQGHVATVQAHPPDRAGATDGGLDRIARVLEKECRHLHARYIKGAPAVMELALECRTRLFAAPPEPPARRRQLGMSVPGRRRAPAVRRA